MMLRLVALTVVLIALLSPATAAPLYSVTSSSMMPALGEGDVVLAVPDVAPKQRGDIVVFTRDGEIYISRIIGLPGEIITVVDGAVFVDTTPLQQHQLVRPIEEGCPRLMYPGKKCAFYRETLPDGSSHVIISMQKDAYFDNTRSGEGKDGKYFVMSDNRDNAIDSREFGPINESAILGIVQNLTFSSRPGSWPDRLSGFPEAQ